MGPTAQAWHRQRHQQPAREGRGGRGAAAAGEGPWGPATRGLQRRERRPITSPRSTKHTAHAPSAGTKAAHEPQPLLQAHLPSPKLTGRGWRLWEGGPELTSSACPVQMGKSRAERGRAKGRKRNEPKVEGCCLGERVSPGPPPHTSEHPACLPRLRALLSLAQVPPMENRNSHANPWGLWQGLNPEAGVWQVDTCVPGPKPSCPTGIWN